MTSSTSQQLGSAQAQSQTKNSEHGRSNNNHSALKRPSCQSEAAKTAPEIQNKDKVRKFDAILDKVVDMKKIDLELLKRWLVDYFPKHKIIDYKLLNDLIIDFLKSERYPCPKVLQCELIDYDILPADRIKRLTRGLWDELLSQEVSAPKAKYPKTSSSSGGSLSSSNRTSSSARGGSSSSIYRNTHNGYQTSKHSTHNGYQTSKHSTPYYTSSSGRNSTDRQAPTYDPLEV